MLIKIPNHERIIYIRDQKCINNLDQYITKWKKTIEKNCEMSKKPLHDSIMFKNEEYR